MGEVWRAFDETLGRPVAVKLMLPHDSDPTATSRFRLEAQTAGRLSHPHVVGVLDFGEHEDRLFLVMELVDGDSLADLLTVSGPLPAEHVARIAAQAALGLAAAHRQGIVHRDIKPANLLLGADDTLKIGDFGIARFRDDPGASLTATGQIVGTSLYLAPERALGRTAGPASDAYSLGCVLYPLVGRAVSPACEVGRCEWSVVWSAAAHHVQVAAAGGGGQVRRWSLAAEQSAISLRSRPVAPGAREVQVGTACEGAQTC
ncbi:hypothetical protein TPA0598_13_00340 [Streptomyces lydicamycinicus]|uniref:non-specific serine/threonine protein kinase n=1 Tax=Streptomyces lydicamycinicus TaxID=1546107 RepID=A0A0P4RHK0_9ACTN|nr:hypothetical protein TPA0598_13_00340 [Streptomyces lydicamycinicus]